MTWLDDGIEGDQVFKRKKWIAVVHGQRWIMAKVAVQPRKQRLKLLKLVEFPERPKPTDPATDISPDERRTEEQQHILNPENAPEGVSMGGVGSEAENMALLAWLKRQKLSRKKLRLALSSPGIITRLITLPLLPAKTLDRLLTEQVGQYFTLDIADYLVDYRVVDRFQEEGEERQRVLLAAVPRQRWVELTGVWQKAGLRPQTVDLAGDCLIRLYSRLGSLGSPVRDDKSPVAANDLAVVELGDEQVEIVLLDQGIFFLYTDLAVDFHGVRAPSSQGGTFGMPAESGGQEVVGNVADAAANHKAMLESLLLPVLQALADFIQFFAARHQGKMLDTIFLTGEYADLPMLTEVFHENLEIETRVGFPVNWQPHFARKMKEKKKDWMKYGRLYGLAFRDH